MINTTTLPKNITTLDFDKITAFPNNRIQISENEKQVDIEEEFASQVAEVTGTNGPFLLKYCENLSDSLVRSFLVESDAVLIRETLGSDLADELGCNPKQAECLIELTLELIHIKVHGDYRISPNVNLGYVITMAAAALGIPVQ